MRYTATIVIEADGLTEAWDKAFIAFPKDLSPDVIDGAEELGLVSFSIGGGSQRVETTFQPTISAAGGYVTGYPYPTVRVPSLPRVAEDLR